MRTALAFSMIFRDVLAQVRRALLRLDAGNAAELGDPRPAERSQICRFGMSWSRCRRIPTRTM
jgi:hypothetical protein